MDPVRPLNAYILLKRGFVCGECRFLGDRAHPFLELYHGLCSAFLLELYQGMSAATCEFDLEYKMMPRQISSTITDSLYQTVR